MISEEQYLHLMIWVDGLRCGRYKQGRTRHLRVVNGRKSTWSAWGVLCEIYRLNNPGSAVWRRHPGRLCSSFGMSGFWMDTMPFVSTLIWVGIGWEAAIRREIDQAVARRTPFDQVANIIHEYAEINFRPQETAP